MRRRGKCPRRRALPLWRDLPDQRVVKDLIFGLHLRRLQSSILKGDHIHPDLEGLLFGVARRPRRASRRDFLDPYLDVFDPCALFNSFSLLPGDHVHLDLEACLEVLQPTLLDALMCHHCRGPYHELTLLDNLLVHARHLQPLLAKILSHHFDFLSCDPLRLAHPITRGLHRGA